MTDNDVTHPAAQALVHAFTQQGYPATLIDTDTIEFTMRDGLTAQCRIATYLQQASATEPESLDSLAEQHAQMILANITNGVQQEALENNSSTLRSQLRVRLCSEDYLQNLPFGERKDFMIRPFADDLSEVVVIDYPDKTALMNRSTAESVGMSEEDCFTTAVVQSCNTEPHEVSVFEPNDVPLIHIHEQHPYISANIHVLKRFISPAQAPNGAFVSFPTPELILAHPIGGTHIFHAIDTMQEVSRTYFDDGQKPISAQVFWWRPGSHEEQDELAAISSGSLPDLQPVSIRIDHESKSIDWYGSKDFGELLSELSGSPLPDEQQESENQQAAQAAEQLRKVDRHMALAVAHNFVKNDYPDAELLWGSPDQPAEPDMIDGIWRIAGNTDRYLMVSSQCGSYQLPTVSFGSERFQAGTRGYVRCVCQGLRQINQQALADALDAELHADRLEYFFVEAHLAEQDGRMEFDSYSVRQFMISDSEH